MDKKKYGDENQMNKIEKKLRGREREKGSDNLKVFPSNLLTQCNEHKKGEST